MAPRAELTELEWAEADVVVLQPVVRAMGEQADRAPAAVIQELVGAAADQVLRDCVALGAPVPEFVVRTGREPVEPYDERYPHLTEVLLAQLDPAGVHVHVSVPPNRSSVTVRAGGAAVWACPTPPGFSAAIGSLAF